MQLCTRALQNVFALLKPAPRLKLARRPSTPKLSKNGSSNHETSRKGSIVLPAEKLKIVVTQPRRVAAISMTKRICFERGLKNFDGEVSYAIRFDDRTSASTNLRYVTDGILVRECISVGFDSSLGSATREVQRGHTR